jgi:16S rRNA (cytidine1402-2'-O)-methyltransferase
MTNELSSLLMPKLVLIPNTLDLGIEPPPPLSAVLPMAVIQRAAGLTHWVVENAKSARAFLKRVDAVQPLVQPLQALHIVELPRPTKGAAHAAPADLTPLLTLATQGHDIGLLSEAGLPAVADPGAGLVAAAHRAGIAVDVLPGPSSITLAVAASGLQGQRFAFVGYLPTDAAQRTARVRALEAHSKREQQTQVAIETPYRNAALMAALIDALQPSTLLSVACGLTLPGGWCSTHTVAQWRLAPPRFESKHVPAVFCWLTQ